MTHLIVGLGNPGKEYELTRHNAGFLAMDLLAEQCGVSLTQAKYHALIADASFAGKRVLLMKPQTYMNASGKAVAEAANFYHLTPDHILVYSDDISLAPNALHLAFERAVACAVIYLFPLHKSILLDLLTKLLL